MKAVLNGHLRAFDSLVERYFSMISMIGYARLGCREAVEDLAQEVFLRAYLNLNHLNPPASFGPWISQIARNLATDWVKQQRRSSQLISMIPVEQLSDERIGQRSEGASTRMDNQEQHQLIHDVIRQLNPLQREIVLLHYVEEWSNKEIAERLAIHPGNVGRQLKKALKTMKRTFEPMLRGSAAGLRPARPAFIRTVALIGAASILPASTKAALLTAATVTGTASGSCTVGTPVAGRIIGWLRAAPATLTTGGPAVILAKGTALAALTVALAFGGRRIFSNNRAAASPPVNRTIQHSVADRGESETPFHAPKVVMSASDPKPNTPNARKEPVRTDEQLQAAADSPEMMASAADVAGSGVEPKPEPSATTQTMKQEPDFDLILQVANAHRQNLQAMKTWQGKARVEHWYYETEKLTPETKSEYQSVVDVSFALDREKKALASKWLVSDPSPLFANVLLTADEFYRYRGTKSGKPPTQLVIYPRSHLTYASPETGDMVGFDPTWYMENPVFNNLDEELLTLRANVANPKKARPWQMPDGVVRTGDRVVVEQTKGRSTWRYTFDLAQGGNLVAYEAGLPDHPLELTITYDRHDGVWVVNSYRKVSIDKPVGDHHGQTRVDKVTLPFTSLNQPLNEAVFTVADLGVKDNDIIEDRRGQIIIMNEADKTRIPPGQELKLSRGPEEWEKYVRGKIISAYPPVNDAEEASIRAILNEMLPEATQYQREHEAEFARLRAESGKLVGLERPRGSREAIELMDATKEINKQWAELESPISVTLYERLHTRVEEIVKAAEEQRRPMHDAEIAKITPKMEETMRTTQYHAFDIAHACYMYANQHKDEFPADLDELVHSANLKPEKLLNPRRPRDKCGYTYIKPVRDVDHFNPAAILAFEVHDQWPEHGVAAAFADGHAEWISDEVRFNRLLKATLMPDSGRSRSSPEAGQTRGPLLLLPDGQLSRSASAILSVEDEWERFVQRFITSYELDPGQQETARSILRELRGEAAQYRIGRREQFEKLDIRLKQLSESSLSNAEQGASFQRALFELRDQRRTLEQPIDDMFNRLKERLQTIPTQAQQQTVATRKKAGGKSRGPAAR